MRLPLVAFAVTLASSLLSFVGGPSTALAAEKTAKPKVEKPHPQKAGKPHLIAKKLPPLPKHLLKHAENTTKPESKALSKPEKPASKPEKAETKVDPKGPSGKGVEKKTSDNPYEDPPEELTGALPQKKIADKKKKADDKAEKKSDKKSEKNDDKAEKKSDKKDDKADKSDDDKKMLLPHGGKASKTSSVTGPANEFQTLQKKASKTKPKTCLNPAISFARLGQPTDVTFSLTTCNGGAAPGAVDNLSILARPYDVPLPSMEPTSALSLQKKSAKPSKALATPGAKEGMKEEVAPGIRRIDPGMVSRLQHIADKFPGKTITLVSGYRPASKGSPHQAARAFDLRIDGVTNEALVAFCRTMPDTGCGYYPNSYFVHVDVRATGAGHVYWIDVSGPGEKPTYVKQWPLPKPALPEIKAATADMLPSETKPDTTTGSSEQAPTTDAAKIGPLEEAEEEATK